MKKLTVLKYICIVAFLIGVIGSACSCSFDSTMFMTEDERSEYLFRESDKYYDPMKYHLGYDITVEYFDGNETNEYKVVFDEYYDATNGSNVKYMRQESLNDFQGFADCCTYVDGMMYLKSDDRSIKASVIDEDQLYSYLDYYGVYCENSFPVTFTCPPIKDGIYTYIQEATLPRKLTSLYENLFWAIPPHLYDQLKIKSYKDTYTFDSNGRILTFEAEIEVNDPDFHTQETVSINFKQTYYYEEFEINAPENGNEYHLINNYYAALDAISVINEYLNEMRGSFDHSFELSLKMDSEEYNCLEQSSLNYSTSDSGILTYDSVSHFSDNSGIEDTVTTIYDGEHLISESAGHRKETPMSQEEAYYSLNGYKDFLWLYDGAIGTVNLYSGFSGSYRRIGFTFTKKYISELLANELDYYYGIQPDKDSLIAEGNCTILVLYNQNGGVADGIEVKGCASFTVDGVPATLTYTYILTVTAHE